MSVLRRYWAEILVVGTVFGVLLMCTASDIVWVNTDCDGPHYIYSAKYLYPAHKTSAPLYLLLSHFFLKIPFGMDAWRMALVSVLASTATAVFIIAAIRHFTVSRWYGVLGALVWGGSALMISQSTIVESYALVTMFGVGAYYFSLKKRWVLTALFLGAGGAVHHLILIPIVVILLANRGEFLKWRYIGIMASFLLFYLYIPITNREPYMWLSGEGTGTNFFVDNFSTMMMLVGGLAIWDVPKRLIDTLGVLGVSLGLALIPIVWWMLRGRTVKWYKEPLVWLFGLPVAYYCFPAGTKIITRGKNEHAKWPDKISRTARSIEELVLGDEVLSYNESTGEKEWKRVTKTYKRTAKNFVLLKLSNGNELRCTDEHPVGVNRRGRITWVPANKVKKGDEVVQAYYHNWQRRIANVQSKGKTVEEIFGEEIGAKHRENNRKSHIGSKGNPIKPSTESRLKMRLSHLGQKPTKEQRRKQSISMKKRWRDDHEYGERVRTKSNATIRARWKNDPEFAQRRLAELIRGQKYKGRMTKPEKILSYILRVTCPHEFRYDGNGKLGLIGRHAPDFVNVNGKKKVIEVFGCYHHNCTQCGHGDAVISGTPADKGRERDARKMRNYEKLGYDCLTIWSHELEVKPNRDAVVKRVKDFVYNPDAEVTHVLSVKKYEEEQPVYNIDVEDNHNYFAHGILVHNCTDLAPQTAVYVFPAIAFGAIITGIALQRLESRHLAYAVAIGAVALLGYHTYAFDIGHKLDPNMEARRFYDEELSKVPDGEILLTQQGWEWAMVYPYNKEEGRNIVPVCAGTLPSTMYQEQLRDWGIAFEVNEADSLRVKSTNIALSIIDSNENVWTTIPTDAANYGAMVVPAKEHREQLINIPKTITDGSMDMVWQWKPSNPYSIITGSIEVEEWTWIVFSNYTVLTFIMMGSIGAVPMWVAWQVLIKKRGWSAKKALHLGREVEVEADD